MTLLRITLAWIILRVDIMLLDFADRLLASAASLAPAPRASETTPALNPAERHMPAARPRPAGLTAPERVLLASIAGIAICGIWIGISWRAAS